MTTKLARFVLYLIIFWCLRNFGASFTVLFSPAGILTDCLLAAVLWLASEFLLGRFLPFLAGNRLAFSAPCGSSTKALLSAVFRQQLFVLAINTFVCLAFVQAAGEIKLLSSIDESTLLLQGVFLLGALFVDGTIRRSINSKTIIGYAEECVGSGDSCQRCASINTTAK